MSALALLFVTVLSSGGPAHDRPSRLLDGVIRVSRNGALVARSTSGRIERPLRPGRYHVAAGLPPDDAVAGRTCEARWVRLQAGRTNRIDLYCSIR